MYSIIYSLIIHHCHWWCFINSFQHYSRIYHHQHRYWCFFTSLAQLHACRHRFFSFFYWPSTISVTDNIQPIKLLMMVYQLTQLTTLHTIVVVTDRLVYYYILACGCRFISSHQKFVYKGYRTKFVYLKAKFDLHWLVQLSGIHHFSYVMWSVTCFYFSIAWNRLVAWQYVHTLVHTLN